MKSIVISVMLFLALCSQGQNGVVGTSGRTDAQDHCTAEDDIAIRQIAERWRTAYNKGKAAEVALLYSGNADYLTQHFASGIVHGRAAIQAYVQVGVDAHYRVDSLQVLSTGCSGDLAYATARYESTNAGKKAIGVNLVVLRKAAGKWMIVAHEAAVPDPATAIQHLNVPAAK